MLVRGISRGFSLALGLWPLTWPGAAPSAQESSRTVPVVVDGRMQIVEGFKDRKLWIQHDLWVETEFDSDGDGELDRMHVDVTRPEQTDTEDLTVGVIYETSPYYGGLGSTNKRYFWNPRQELGELPPLRNFHPPMEQRDLRPRMATTHVDDWVPRGFAVVHSASPGTGLSEGCPSIGGENEALAPKAVIDWLNGRAKGYASLHGDEEVEAYWATGKVGMTGTSFNGTLPIACATTGVDGLEAIIPVAPLTSYYHYYRSNGLVRHPGGYMGEDIDVIFDAILSGYPERREYCRTTVRDGELLENFDRVSGDYNDFWDGRNYRKALKNYRAATLMSHAWNDWNVMSDHSVEIYRALQDKGVPAQAYFHQGGHGGPPPLAQMNRWFTRYVSGIENDVENDARSWIVREEDRPYEPTPYDEYPHPDAAFVTLHLKAGGNGIGGLSTEAAGRQGHELLIDDVSISGTELARSEESDHRLLYGTPKLVEELHISGAPTISVRIACSTAATNLSVWLVSLPWSRGGRITDNIITRGWADPQNHASLRAGEPLEPGEFYRMVFELRPDDQIIPAGQSIALMVFASDRDFTLWPKPGAELTLDLDATALDLPVVGGAEAVRRAFGLSGQ